MSCQTEEAANQYFQVRAEVLTFVYFWFITDTNVSLCPLLLKGFYLSVAADYNVLFVSSLVEMFESVCMINFRVRTPPSVTHSKLKGGSENHKRNQFFLLSIIRCFCDCDKWIPCHHLTSPTLQPPRKGSDCCWPWNCSPGRGL